MADAHTPGEWINVGTLTTGDFKGWKVIKVSGDAALALVREYADADLIVAAPETAAERDRLKEINAELLAALTLALPYIQKVAATAPTEYGRMVRQRQAVKDAADARAAIARATVTP